MVIPKRSICWIRSSHIDDVNLFRVGTMVINFPCRWPWRSKTQQQNAEQMQQKCVLFHVLSVGVLWTHTLLHSVVCFCITLAWYIYNALGLVHWVLSLCQHWSAAIAIYCWRKSRMCDGSMIVCLFLTRIAITR